MKHKVLLTTLGLGLSLLALSSYDDGPAHGGAGNRSGSLNSPSCAAGGCHGGESTNLGLTLTLTDLATSTVVTQYEAGHSYTVSLVGLWSGAAAYSHLGFQASVVNTGNTNSGTLAATAANTATISISGLSLIEHTAPIAKTGTEYKTTFKWTAPTTAGSGDAKFYARMLANNNNNTSGDDTPNAIQATFTEKVNPVSINDVKRDDIFRIYPNPAQDKLNVKLSQLNAGKYDVSISSIDGKSMIHATSNFVAGEMTIDISKLAKGVYTLAIKNESGQQVVRFVRK